MNKNLVSEVAKLLEVELGEHFKICSKVGAKIDSPFFTNEYFLDEKGGLMCSNEDSFCKADVSILGKIILGDFEIVKLPWKPKHNEPYYRPNIMCKSVSNELWSGSTLDYTLKSLGMVYHTKEEAEAHLADDYEWLTGKPLSSR